MPVSVGKHVAHGYATEVQHRMSANCFISDVAALGLEGLEMTHSDESSGRPVRLAKGVRLCDTRIGDLAG